MVRNTTFPSLELPTSVASALDELRPGLSDLLLRVHAAAQDSFGVAEHCVDFELLPPDQLRDASARSFHSDFWRQTAALLLIVSRSAPVALHQLIAGIVWSFDRREEVSLALHLRALMEHASVLSVATHGLANWRVRLVAAWRKWGTEPLEPNEADWAAYEAMAQFALSRRIDVGSGKQGTPRTAKEYAAFLDGLQVSDGHPYKARQVLGDVDKVQRRALPRWRVAYECLCEYCHPNSASRMGAFAELIAEGGRRRFQIQTDADWTPGWLWLSTLTREVLPGCCELISSALDELGRCRCPMEPIEEPATRCGLIPAVDQFGRRFFVNRAEVDGDQHLTQRRALTSGQLQRLRRIHSVFSFELGNKPLVEWIKDFEHEPDVEDELLLWERMASVFERELAERNDARMDIRRLLFIAVESLMTMSLDDAIFANPGLKGLPKLDRVTRRIEAALLNQPRYKWKRPF